MRDASICGLGQTASSAIESAIFRLARSPGGAREARTDPGFSRRHRRAGRRRHRTAPPRRRSRWSSTASARRPRPARRFSTRAARVASTSRRSASCRTLTPVNVCRVCVVEVTGSRVLVPACSRRVEPGMDDLDRVRARARVAAGWSSSSWRSSVDLSTAPGLDDMHAALRRASRRGMGAPPRPRPPGERDAREPGHHEAPDGAQAETVAQPVEGRQRSLRPRLLEVRALLQVRRGLRRVDAQNTFAIAVAGRGFDARISTEADVPLPGFGLRLLRQLHRRLPDRRADVQARARHAGDRNVGRIEASTTTDTICPYCGVGCTLSLHGPGQPDREGDIAARRRRSPAATSASKAASALPSSSLLLATTRLAPREAGEAVAGRGR